MKLFFIFLTAALISIPALAEEVPLVKYGGVYHTSVRINDTLNLKFVVDSGASMVFLPTQVYEKLKEAGTVRSADIRRKGKARVADGSIIRIRYVNIKTLQIGDTKIHDVLAAVGKGVDPLFGQSALKKLEPWNIDTKKNILSFGKINTLHHNFVSSSQQISRFEALDFVRFYLDLQKNKKIDRTMQSYASEVDYLQQGVVPQAFIRVQKEKFFNEWKKIEMHMIRLLDTKDTGGDKGQIEVKFSMVSSLYSDDSYRNKSEHAIVTLILKKRDDKIVIVSEKVDKKKKYY